MVYKTMSLQSPRSLLWRLARQENSPLVQHAKNLNKRYNILCFLLDSKDRLEYFSLFQRPIAQLVTDSVSLSRLEVPNLHLFQTKQCCVPLANCMCWIKIP